MVTRGPNPENKVDRVTICSSIDAFLPQQLQTCGLALSWWNITFSLFNWGFLLLQINIKSVENFWMIFADDSFTFLKVIIVGARCGCYLELPKKTVAIALLAERRILAFLGACSPVATHCFEWWIQVSPTVIIKQHNNLFGFSLNSNKLDLEVAIRLRLWSTVSNSSIQFLFKLTRLTLS